MNIKSNVKYDADMRAKAKAEGLHLCTLDIEGAMAKKGRSTIQCYLFTEDEVKRVDEFFKWLMLDKKKERNAATKELTRSDIPPCLEAGG